MKKSTTNKELLKNYILFNDSDAFQQLYSNIELRLKKVITDVTYIFVPKVKNQKGDKIHKIEDKLGMKINMHHIMELYKDEYIKKVYSVDYNRFTNPKYNLIYPFWQLLEKLKSKLIDKYQKKLDKTLPNDTSTIWEYIELELKTYKISTSKYLAMKFCDQYWLHIEKCLRRDYPERHTRNSHKEKVEYIEDIITCSNTAKHNKSSNSMEYKNGLYSSLDTSIAKEKTYNFESEKKVKLMLSQRELEVLDLLLEGNCLKEIASKLNILPGNVSTVINRIKTKTKALSSKTANLPIK